ncbi:MAG: asparagine synthase (glutamine-hydrolyzing) [Gammaproteobacteria bacterium]
MCGIAGELHLTSQRRVDCAVIEHMLAPIGHRGPDARGIFLDTSVGLGHCRLSIIDVDGGGQPMTNEDETVWIVFNGEIYNFQSLRKQLISRGHVFRSRTDTEVIIHLYEEHGTDCLRFLRGMFAFAIWDKSKQRLFVARDRVGIKPLYYCQSGDNLYFASEVKSIIANTDIPRDIDALTIRRFLTLKYVPGADTLFRSVHKLLPGHYLVAEKGILSIQQYWDLQFSKDRWSKPFDTVVEELHDLLGTTIHDHMIADVPVGVLLSGGVDSSAILSFAVHGTSTKMKSFTVGFDDARVVDERPYARIAAERFGTEHFEISISADDFWHFLPSYVWHMEEPICQPPAVALHYVSKLARSHVKVLLSGEGGDEAFAGYPNYPNMLRLKRFSCLFGPFARPLGAVMGFGAGLLAMHRVQRYAEAMGRPLSEHYFSRTSYPSVYFHRRAAEVFTPDFLRETGSISYTQFPPGVFRANRDWSLLDQMLYVDTKTWLPDDLLVKADKITMANSLELRVPLLDHKVLEFAASLHPRHKVQGRDTKRVLKAAFSKELPPEILNRKKAGFPVPFTSWLENELADRVKEILLDGSSLRRGYFKVRFLERFLMKGRLSQYWSDQVFSLLVLELWHREFVDSRLS